MCFSAQASFIASGTLLALGSYALKKVKNKTSLPLALTPVFFAIQQATEGFIWLGNTHENMAAFVPAATWLYLFFAFFFWPIWIPAVTLLLEKKMERKHILFFLLGVGYTVASTLAYATILSGAQPEISCSHIHYNVTLPEMLNFWGPLMYCLATIMPFFVSTRRYFWIFGIGLTISVVVTHFFYTAFFTSVWCFFSALLSIGIIALL